MSTKNLTKEQQEAFCGVLQVEILCGKSIALKDGEKYLVHSSFTKGLTAGGLYRTGKASHSVLQWNAGHKVQLIRKLTGDDTLVLSLMESSIFPTDDVVGVGQVQLQPLYEGDKIDEPEVKITDKKGSQIASVAIRVSWLNDNVPEMGGNSLARKGSMIRGNASQQSTDPSQPNQAARKPAVELPPTEGNDYTVRVRVHKARNLQSTKEDTLYDPLVAVQIAGETQSIDYAEETNNPIWDDELVFTFEKVGPNWFNTPILVKVLDHHVARPNTTIGSVQMDCASVYQDNVKHVTEYKWYVLHRNVVDGHVVGFIKLSICVLDMRKDPVPDPSPDTADDDEDEIVNNLISGPGARFEEMTLHCDVFRAEDIPPMDTPLNPFQKGLADPFVKFQFGTRTVNTPVIENNLNPTWNTAVKLPLLLPCLTNNMTMSMWDSDRLSADDLIGMQRIPISSLMNAGKGGLPAYKARFVTFYGGPRGSDADFNASYKAMAKGMREGLDYRGRLLVRMAGSRTSSGAGPMAQIAVHETTVFFKAVVQVLQLSLVPSGSWEFRVSCGLHDAKSNSRRVHPMSNSGLNATLFGEEIRIEGSFAVILPENDDDPSTAEQIPDIILHLHATGKDTPFAALRFPATKMLSSHEGQYTCQCMSVFSDPGKATQGEQPTEPLVQAVFGMFIHKADGYNKEKVPVAESVVVPAILNTEPTPYKLECCVYQARQLPAGDDTGLSDPFIRISWADGAGQTGTKMETLNPIFNEFVLINSQAKQPFSDIVVEIWDWDFFGANTFLAKKVISAEDAFSDENAGETRWYSGFTDSRGKLIPECEVLLNFEIVGVTKENEQSWYELPKQKFLKRVGTNDTYTGFAIPANKQLPTSIYKLSSSIFSLRHMRSYHLMNIKCPSIVAEVAGHTVELDKIFGSNPDFNKQFDLYVELPENPEYLPRLNFRVYENRFGPRSLVGATSIAIDSKNFAPQWKDHAKLQADNAVAERLYKLDEFKGIAVRQAERGGPVNTARINQAKFKATGKLLISNTKQKRRKVSDKPNSNEDSDLYEALLQGDDEIPEPGSTAVLTAGSLQAKDGTPKPPLAAEEMTDRSDDAPNFEDAVAATTEVSQLFLKHEEEEKIEALQRADEEKRREEEDRLWFDRFDPVGLDVKPELQVTRLGNVSGIVAPNHSTLEDYYGPFDDEIQKLKLYRGWGSERTVGGTLLFDLTVVKMKQPPPGIVAAATSAPTPGKSAAQVEFAPPKTIESRQPVKFVAHIYILSCKNLAPKDDSILGKAADPYPILQLGNKSNKKDNIKLSCKDDKKFQTLNPEFFLVREMRGTLPKQDTLTISVYDYDRIGSDELIGTTEIDLEARWHSRRGYKHRNMTTLRQGSYTETRFLRNELGQLQGSIELWVDMYDAEYQVVPKPIEITPPPPVPLELRAVVWNTRDVIMQEESIHGEAMTDIYVRCWMDGMSHDIQSTDVHYRSLDGTGNFNWRMKFPFVFEPRTRRIMPTNSKTTQKSFFHIRREQKKFEPVLHVQIWDNDLLPGTDDFIGEISLKLQDLRPTVSRRDPETLIGIIGKEISCCCNCYPFNTCCTHRNGPPEELLTLKQKQKRAAAEARHDREEQEMKWRRQAEKKVKALKETHPEYTDLQLERLRQSLYNDIRLNAVVNVFKPYMPTNKKKSKTKGQAEENEQGSMASTNSAEGDKEKKEEGGGVFGFFNRKGKKKDEDPGAVAVAPEDRNTADGKTKDAESGSGMPSFADLPKSSETPKYWFPCRGPNGGGRVGDVQISFELVRADVLEGDNADSSLLAGKGRSSPNALPEPKRPDSSFFWLSSPWKSAVHILWKQYKWYIMTILCLAILVLFIWVFLSEGTREKAKTFFNTGTFDSENPGTTVVVHLDNATATPSP